MHNVAPTILAAQHGGNGASLSRLGVSAGRRAESSSAVNSPTSLRLRVGDIAAELRSFDHQRDFRIRVAGSTVVLVVPVTGICEIATDVGRESITPDSALFLARINSASAIWSEGARGLVLRIPRVRLQALASARLGEPRRLAGIDRRIDCADAIATSIRCLTGFVENGGRVSGDSIATGRSIDMALLSGIVDALSVPSDRGEIFPIARSVKRATDHIRQHSDDDCSAEALAAIAGVTVPTLRRNFRDCLGTPLSVFVQGARLDAAQTSLESCTDSRSLSRLAVDIGFSGPSSFSRAYHQRFGETPSQTRANAVRSAQL